MLTTDGRRGGGGSGTGDAAGRGCSHEIASKNESRTLLKLRRFVNFQRNAK